MKNCPWTHIAKPYSSHFLMSSHSASSTVTLQTLPYAPISKMLIPLLHLHLHLHGRPYHHLPVAEGCLKPSSLISSGQDMKRGIDCGVLGWVGLRQKYMRVFTTISLFLPTRNKHKRKGYLVLLTHTFPPCLFRPRLPLW